MVFHEANDIKILFRGRAGGEEREERSRSLSLVKRKPSQLF